MSIYLVRHGERQDMADPAWRDRAAALGADYDDTPLSAAGRAQARDTAISLVQSMRQANVDPKSVVILASPCVRSRVCLCVCGCV